MKSRAQTSLKDYRLTITASTLLFLISVNSTIRLIQGELYSEYFATSTSTVIYYSAVFIATAVMLSGRSVKDVEVFAVSLSTTISTIWFYEFVYHYFFPVYFNYFRYPYFGFKDLKTLFNDGGLTALILVGYRYITLRRNYFLAPFTLFSVT